MADTHHATAGVCSPRVTEVTGMGGSSPRALTVLLVEDDVRVATMTAEWLRRIGYEVIVCADGPQALKAASARTEPIDLLVADVMLPGMRGPVLAGALRGSHPQMAVLFTSGYSPELLGEMFSSTMDSALLLYKPYTPEQLASRVHLALARKPGVAAPQGES
jgi:two-component system cell cycle sensor histidine kinase/response regulator CckA